MASHMDTLAALDSLDGGRGFAPAPHSEGGGDGSATRLKYITMQSRRRSRGSTVSSLDRKCSPRPKIDSRDSSQKGQKKQTTTGGDDELELSVVPYDPEAISAVDEKRPCLGCNRSYEKSNCYVTDDTGQWALLDGRGAWCRDCFNL